MLRRRMSEFGNLKGTEPSLRPCRMREMPLRDAQVSRSAVVIGKRAAQRGNNADQADAQRPFQSGPQQFRRYMELEHHRAEVAADGGHAVAVEHQPRHRTAEQATQQRQQHGFQHHRRHHRQAAETDRAHGGDLAHGWPLPHTWC